MKRLRLAFAAAFALGLGMSGGVSAVESDPGCLTYCLEERADCIAEAKEYGFPVRICVADYNACVADCGG